MSKAGVLGKCGVPFEVCGTGKTVLQARLRRIGQIKADSFEKFSVKKMCEPHRKTAFRLSFRKLQTNLPCGRKKPTFGALKTMR